MPDSLFSIIAIPILAVALDWLIGDPKSWPHPVRVIGATLDAIEASAEKVDLSIKTTGWITLLSFPALAWGITAILISLPILGSLVAVYLSFAGLALGCLLKDAEEVTRQIDRGKLEDARKALSYLVSRDTSAMDAPEMRKTLAETMSENLNDGFVAPLFYLCLLGPGGLWAYKVVSTMDSMWGYRTTRFQELGFAGARADDVLAYVPARLTAKLLMGAGSRMGLNTELAAANYQGDAQQMESPNAGHPMAAAAWLAMGEMGGKFVYGGKLKDKPVMGPKGSSWDAKKLRTLFQLCRKAGFYAICTFIPVLGLTQWILFKT